MFYSQIDVRHDNLYIRVNTQIVGKTSRIYSSLAHP